MADHHERQGGGHHRTGHADPQYRPAERPFRACRGGDDAHADVLYGGDREGEYTAETGGGHRGLGRRPLAIPEEFQEVRSLWEDGMYSAAMAASILGVDRHTFMKWVRDEKIV